MTANFEWTTGPLAEGLNCYRTELFFEAHEHWESVWLTLFEPEKSFLQSLVQISAAFHHLRRGNRVGAISLLSRSLKRLERCSPAFCGINIERLRGEVREWLAALQSNRTQLPTSFPRIALVDAESSKTRTTAP
jgi:predicted metal-dependent hydrolase